MADKTNTKRVRIDWGKVWQASRDAPVQVVPVGPVEVVAELRGLEYPSVASFLAHVHALDYLPRTADYEIRTAEVDNTLHRGASFEGRQAGRAVVPAIVLGTVAAAL